MEFVTHFIATKNSTNLSVDSALKKMYKPGASIVDSVRNILRHILTVTHTNIILFLPLIELIIRMAQKNASVTCLTLALLFLAHFIYDYTRQSVPLV